MTLLTEYKKSYIFRDQTFNKGCEASAALFIYLLLGLELPEL